MCWERWKGKGLVVLPVPWADRLPFSRPPAPDTEANRCPIPMAENAPGAIANCPGWNNRGCPVFSGLKNCWLCRPESAKLWRCPAPKCDGLSVCTIRGEKLSLLLLRPPFSVSFFDKSVSFLGLLSSLSFSKLLMLNIESLDFRDSG